MLLFFFVFYAFFAVKTGKRRGRPWQLTAKNAKRDDRD